jgi:hypothetical protein
MVIRKNPVHCCGENSWTGDDEIPVDNNPMIYEKQRIIPLILNIISRESRKLKGDRPQTNDQKIINGRKNKKTAIILYYFT